MARRGGDWRLGLRSVALASAYAAPPPPPAPTVDAPSCRSHFGRWCLDGTHLSRQAIMGIIVASCVFLALCVGIAAVVLLCLPHPQGRHVR